MMPIKWHNGLARAEKEAHASNKLVLLFFHSAKCGGCRKTESTTFTDATVVELVEKCCAPVSLDVMADQGLTAQYRVEWTPTFILADSTGAELERWIGFLPPEEFIPQLYLAIGLSSFHRNQFQQAETAFEWIIDNHSSSVAAPQARYYMGVALYKATGDASHLKRTWEAMNRRYPNDFWTKKASAWS